MDDRLAQGTEVGEPLNIVDQEKPLFVEHTVWSCLLVNGACYGDDASCRCACHATLGITRGRQGNERR
jgi:hypothetical protein